MPQHDFTRPELEQDPDHYPGQITYPIPRAMYLRDIIARIEASEDAWEECCHKTVLAGQRCERCPYGH